MNGLIIRRMRRASGMTQNELAVKVGVHRTTVNRWEKSGHVRHGAMIKAAIFAAGFKGTE